MGQSIRISSDIRDIIDINRRQIQARDGIRIIELSSLGDIIPYRTAESIRRRLMSNSVQVRQLTNHRSFESWTGVPGYIEACMDIRHISEELLPIEVELLIFDDIVAMYQLEPQVSVTIIEHAAFAAQQKALFDNFWRIADKLDLKEYGSTT